MQRSKNLNRGSTKSRKLDKIEVLNAAESPRLKRGFLLPELQAPKITNSIFGGRTWKTHKVN